MDADDPRFYHGGLDQLPVLSYELERTDYSMRVSLARTHHDPPAWAILRGASALCKTPADNGFFHFVEQPLPSNREDDWLAEHRWPSPGEALAFYRDNRARILATTANLAAAREVRE